jgi:hypothetical protein
MKKLFLTLGLLLLSLGRVSADQFQADYNVKLISVIAANNTTSIPIKATAGTVYSVDAFNNGASVIYVKLYNSPVVTCGVGTPYARYLIPFGASSSGGGFTAPMTNGDAYYSGISMCITGGIADNDTTAPPSSTVIVNIHYK